METTARVEREAFMSQVGKEILIKVILQAIPIYVMQNFLFRKSLCDEIEAMVRHFL